MAMQGMIESIPGGVVRAYMAGQAMIRLLSVKMQQTLLHMAGQAMIRLLSIKMQQTLVHMAMQGMIESIPGGVVRVYMAGTAMIRLLSM